MRAPAVVALVLAAALLTACSGQSDVRRFVAETYEPRSSPGDSTALYSSRDPVGTTTARIVERARPAARQADGGAEYLRYDRDIVIVTPTSAGSSIRIEDLGGSYSGGAFVFLGPGFNPGSPAGGVGGGGGGFGGPGSAK